jgi:hypothetical protein
MQQDDDDLDAELEDIADQIQVGDRTEGARALKQVIDRARGSEDTRRTVRSELASMRFEAENSAALKRFADDYPDVAKDELLAEAGVTALRRELEQDLKKIGLKDEQLKPVRGDTHAMVRAHTEARMRGAKVRAPEEILSATGKVLSERFNIHPRSDRLTPDERIRQMRTQRGFSEEADGSGRSSANLQPERGSTPAHVRRVATPGHVRQIAPERVSGRPSTADWIAKQRAARGFPATD